jgi:hypothetical protein
MSLEYPTQEELAFLFDYNPETGIFIWKYRPLEMFNISRWQERNHKIWNTRFMGKKAGCSDGRYITIRINGIQYWAHRLAYIYIYGKMTLPEIDHINRNGKDNRISNLRCVDRQTNQLNVGNTSKNKTGVAGVHYDNQRKKWHVQIKTENNPRFVGRFDSFNDAVKNRYDAEIKYGFDKINHNSVAYQYLHENRA